MTAIAAISITGENITSAMMEIDNRKRAVSNWSILAQQLKSENTQRIVDILKLSDTNYYISTLRNFRDNYLRYKMEYKHLLVEYDIVGPIICENLIMDKQKRLIASKLFYNYISPVVSLIEDKMFMDSIVRYSMMVNKLKDVYSINANITNKDIEDCDINLAGHGQYQKKYKY